MLAQGGLAFVGKTQRACFRPFPLALAARTRMAERHPVQESQLSILGGPLEERFELDPSPTPVAEGDQGGDQVGPDLEPRLVLREEGAIHGDLVEGPVLGAEGRGLPETGLEIDRVDREHFVERPFRLGDQPETEKGPTDPDPGRNEPRLQSRGLSVESQGERRNSPFEPGPGPTHNRIQLLRARQEPTGGWRDRSGLVPEVDLETELTDQFMEPRPFDHGTPLLGDLRGYGERKMPRRQDHEVHGKGRLPSAEQAMDAIEGDLVGVLEEGVEEPIAGTEREAFRDRLRRVELLAHGGDEAARQLDKGGRRHWRSNGPSIKYGRLGRATGVRRERSRRGGLNTLEPPGLAVDLAGLYRYLPALETEIRASYAASRPAAPGTVRPFIDTNREFTLRGGKRFRAILVLAGYHITTGRDPRPVLRTAAAMEHFQSWMLIHDDIIDHSEERRGGPTVHRMMATAHRTAGRAGSSEEYGMGIGITLGDLEEPYTVEAILGTPTPPPTRLAALAEYVRMTRLTAYGQLLDIRNGTLPPGEVTERDVLDVHRLKSAIYTVVSPLRIGSLLGGSSPGRLADLEAVGTDLGIAFQLRDDVLGSGFDADESGKSANDLKEGKRTLLVVQAWKKGRPADRARLQRVLGNANATPEDIERAREVIRSTGSLDYSEKRIAGLTRRALGRLAASRTIPARGKPLLREVADRLVRRRS